MSTAYRKNFQIRPTEVDRYGRLKPSAMLLYIQQIAGEHSDSYNLTYDALAERGIFWAVIRHQLEIHRLPTQGETIRVETWPMPTTRSAFPRAAAGYDEKGNLVFRCTSLWVLMDIESRQMVLPGRSGIDLEGLVRGDELAAPGSLYPIEGDVAATRRVWYSELDRNGHMNNTRYLDWALDLLEPEFHRQNTLRKATLCYLSEIREGEDIQLVRTTSPEGIFRVDAHRARTDVPSKTERVFAVQLEI